MSIPALFFFKMVNNNNSDTTKELIAAGRLQVIQGVPQTIANYIQPVIEVNPKLLRNVTILKALSRTTTAASTNNIYTTPADTDFFLCGACLSESKDVLCDVSTGRSSITITPVGQAATTLLQINHVTLTASSLSNSIDLNRPIKLERGSAISAGAYAYTAGTAANSYSIWGYTVDNVNA